LKQQKIQEDIYNTILKSVPPPLTSSNTIQLKEIQQNLNINLSDMDVFFDGVFSTSLISTNTGNERFLEHLKRIVYNHEMFKTIGSSCILK